MARKEDKLRPYRIDYFDINEMRDTDQALVKSTLTRAVTADEAVSNVLDKPSFNPALVVIRAYRYYKKLGNHKRDVYKSVEELFSAKRTLDVMEQVELYRANNPKAPDHAVPDPAYGVDKATFYKNSAGTQLTGTTAYSSGHVTRMSDSSLYDEVCVHCGATDTSGKLDEPCPVRPRPTMVGVDPDAAVQAMDAKAVTPCRCSFAFPMSSEAMVLHMQSVHNVPASGPDSPATVAVVKDLAGMLSHDAHEQLMDKVKLDVPAGVRVPDASNTIEHGDDIAAAVADYNRVFPEPPALNCPMPGAPRISDCGCEGDPEGTGLVGKIVAVAGVLVAAVVLVYFLSHILH
jgi:hypothetical protein